MAVQKLMYETIQAAHNLTIQLAPTVWRLVNGAQSPGQSGEMIALLEAHPDEIRCAPVFARARRLPADGRLVPADITRVVVGWAPESHNWHLGLMLAAQPDTNFRSRWCGLASWPSGQAGEYIEQARQAGQSLARIIDRPFHLVPPATPVRIELEETQMLQTTMRIDTIPVEDVSRSVPPQAPPFEFEEWVMAAAPRGLIWRRRRRWLAVAAARLIAYTVVIGLFLILAVGAQTRGLAEVNPAWLPTLGIAVAATLTVITVVSGASLLATSDVIIDTTAREVRRRNRFFGGVRWRLPFDSITYVLISQTPARPQGRKHPGKPMSTIQDVWIHLYDGRRFRPVVGLEHIEGECHDWENACQTLKTPGRRRLKLADYDTPGHHAALVMAQTLDVDVWLDVRS
jgi:hypothetical protein